MKILALLLCFVFMPLSALSEQSAEQPLYQATTIKEINIRAEADSSSRYVSKVPGKTKILVYEYGDEWCRVSWRDKTGWTRTNGLYMYWKLADEPLPNMVFNTGLAVMKRDVHVEHADKSDGDLFTGTDLKPGVMVGAISADGEIPFRRYTEMLPEGSFDFVPFVSAEDAQPGDLLYGFTTYYNEGVGGPLAEAREQNIALAAERISGAVVGPGKQFSYNGLCGRYVPEDGYVNAPNISKSGQGVGGGVCQLSTTLFEAILGLELQLDEWVVHQVSGVRYAPLNFDCAVSNHQDFKFTNTYPWPLRVEAMTQGGALTVLLYRGE